MIANQTILQPLLEGSKQYVMPLYQRAYSWKEKDWKVLWQDISELVLDVQAPQHFLGSIVTLPLDPSPEGVIQFLVIDGQQRLTTLFVLLIAIREAAKAYPTDSLSQQIDFYLVNPFASIEQKFKLQPTQTDGDRDCYKLLATTEGATNPLYKDNGIQRAYNFFSNQLRREEYNLEKLKRLLQVLMQQVIVVSIRLEGQDDPHLIFESLNAKGEPLSQSDLVRNYVLMRLSSSEQETLYRNQWEPMQNTLGNAMPDFLRHVLSRGGKLVDRKNVYRDFKVWASQQPSSAAALAALSPFADTYSRFLDPSKENDTAIRERLERLKRIEITIAYPFLLNIWQEWQQGNLTRDDIIGVLDTIENYAVRRQTCGFATHGQNRMFLALYAQIAADTNRVQALQIALASKQNYYPSDALFYERLTDGLLYRPGEAIDKLQMVLERIESSYGGHEQVDTSNATIEHIMPQRLTSSWESELGSDAAQIHQEWLHTLGNLTLVEPSVNSSLSNKPFTKKKEDLQKSYLKLNQWIVQQDQWTEETIKQRAKELAQRAMTIWPSFAPHLSLTTTSQVGVTGTTPQQLEINGNVISVSSWTDVAQKMLEWIIKNSPEGFDAVAQQFPRLVSTNSNSLRVPRPLSNGFYREANFSASSIHRLCVQVTETIGIEPDQWKIQYG